MTEHPIGLVRSRQSAESGKHPLGQLDSARVAKHLLLFSARPDDVDQLVELARLHIPGIASPEIVRKVVGYNPDCLWTIARRPLVDGIIPSAEGFIAFLPLRTQGLRMLAAGTFNGADPDLRLIAPPDEKPAGIYIWAIHAPGRLAGAVSLFMQALDRAPYHGVNLYTRPNTEEGLRFNEGLGLTKGPTLFGIAAPHLYEYARTPKAAPLYDSRRSAGPGEGTSICVARSFEDLFKVTTIRSAVYIGEQECPFEEEFDGNDMSASHLIGYSGDEPAGCIRVRYFADFAKIERLAVRKEFRNSRLSFQLVRAAIDLCRMKGYRRLYGHAQKRLVPFWSRFGFHEFAGGRALVFSDFDYVEMVAEIQPHPDAIAIGGDPYRVIRPEGRWHMPGILEQSSARPVSRPSVGGTS